MPPNTKGLSRPTPSFANQKLSIKTVDPGRLIRLSRHKTGEPYFNNSGRNRFDDPAGKYKTCYFGLELSTAICESLLHDIDPVDGFFYIHLPRLETYNVYRYDGIPLKLASLTAESLKRIGLHGGLSGTPYYNTPQQWSAAIYNHPKTVDGFIYPSRHLTSKAAVVLFDRARGKIQAHPPEELQKFEGWASAARRLGIRGIW